MATWLAINISANSNSVKGDLFRMPVFYIEAFKNAGKSKKESPFPAPACGGRRLRSTACKKRSTYPTGVGGSPAAPKVTSRYPVTLWAVLCLIK
jgi:hypothetical protein